MLLRHLSLPHNFQRPLHHWCGVVLISMGLLSIPAHGDPPDPLDKKVERFDSHVGSEFREACRVADAPCGEEFALCGDITSDLTAPHLRMEHGNLRKLLDGIISRYPNYKWVIRGKVINFEPLVHKGEDVLARRIDHLSIHNVSSLKAAWMVLAAADINALPGWSFVRMPQLYSPINLEIQDMSVRDALNSIAQLDGHVRWFYCPGNPEINQNRPSFIMSSWNKTGIIGRDKNGNLQ